MIKVGKWIAKHKILIIIIGIILLIPSYLGMAASQNQLRCIKLPAGYPGNS